MVKLNPDDLHIHPTRKHKDCDWFDESDFECTNWREFCDPECEAFVECYAPIGSIFKEVKNK